MWPWILWMGIVSVTHSNRCKTGIISDCSLARRFWIGHFSVMYQRLVAGLKLQELTVRFCAMSFCFICILISSPCADQNHVIRVCYAIRVMQSKYGYI